jgi:tetratricopeptide (TPR) repeat protein
MKKPPIKYNPAFLTDEELIKAFVVRQDDLKLIMTVILENTGDSNQHVLIIGPRGIGKTMLVLRAALEVRLDEDLKQKWYPIIFAEESYEVGTAGEFWLESLFHLGRQTGDQRWIQTYNDLKSEPVEDRLRERALSQLLDFADSQGKRILLIVENLNMILADQIPDDHAWKIRGTLMHEPRIMLLATAMMQIDMPENTHKPGHAMFELFKSHVLKTLNNEECQAVWRSVAGQELGTRRIRAVSILTGGNPRLLAIISHFSASLSFAELMQEMTSLVDDHTDYFKSHLDALPSTERKVYVALADLWDPSTARQVADASRLGVSKTSSLLNRLAGRGAVTELRGKGRTKRYQVAERLYNIYYLMRRRGTPSERVKSIVQFMVQFYEEKELVEVARHLTEEACHLPYGDRQYHFYAFEGIMRITSYPLRSRIIQCTSQDFLEALDMPESTRKCLKETYIETVSPCRPRKHPNEHINDLMRKGIKAYHEGKKEEAEYNFREALGEDSMYCEAWIWLGRILNKQPKGKGEAEQAFLKATEVAPSNPCAWDFLGRFLSNKKGRQLEAQNAFRKALDIYPDCCDAWLGLAMLAGSEPGKEKETEQAYYEAEEACLRQTQKNPEDVRHWKMLALVRHQYTCRFSDAEDAYLKVIEINPKDARAYMYLGNLLHYDLKNYAKAETTYRKAIELDPKLTGALGSLGQLLRDHLDKPEEAKEIFKRIIESDPDNAPFAWKDIGLLYELQQCYTEAETAYRKAIELDPNFTGALLKLGQLLRNHKNKIEEAKLIFLRIIESDSKNAHLAWTDMGLLYERQKSYNEAEDAYRKAINSNPKFHMAWFCLGFLLHERLGRYAEAEDAYNKAIELNPKHSYSRAQLVGLVLTGLKQPEHALNMAKKSIKEIPDNAFLLNNMAWHFFEFGLHKYLIFAEECARQAVILEAVPENIHTLACVLVREGKTDEAIRFTGELLQDSKFTGTNIENMVILFKELVEAGCSAEAYHSLCNSQSAVALEPIAIALQKYMGKDVHVAPEIDDVANDVLKRFQIKD